MATMVEEGRFAEKPFVPTDMTEQRLMSSIEVLAQFGFTDNVSYRRELLRRQNFSVTMPKLNLFVNTEYDLHKILEQHVNYVQKSLGLNPLYWTLQDAMWLLKKLPKPIKTEATPPPAFGMQADSNITSSEVSTAAATSSSSDASVPAMRIGGAGSGRR